MLKQIKRIIYSITISIYSYFLLGLKVSPKQWLLISIFNILKQIRVEFYERSLTLKLFLSFNDASMTFNQTEVTMEWIACYGIKSNKNERNMIPNDSEFDFSLTIQNKSLNNAKKLQTILARNLKDYQIGILSNNQEDQLLLNLKDIQYYLIVYNSDIFEGCYSMITEVYVKVEVQLVFLRSYLLKNGKPIHLDNLAKKIFGFKLAAKINKITTDFFISVHPKNGSLMFYDKMFVNSKNMRFNNDNEYFYCVTQKVVDFISKCQQNINILIYLLDQSQEDLILDSPSILHEIRRLFVSAAKRLKILQNSLYIIPLQLEKNNQNQAIEQKRKQKLLKVCEFIEEKHYPILSRFVDKPLQTQYYKPEEVRMIPEQKYFSCLAQKNDSPYSIYNRIHIPDFHSIKWKFLSQGGFGLVEVAHVKFFIVTHCEDFYSETNVISNRQNLKSEILIKKTDIEQFTSSSKIHRQRSVISSLALKSNPNIVNYFLSSSEIHNGILFSKFEERLSLDVFLKKSASSMCLSTKIYMLMQAARGLLFLHNNSIIHIDIKPQNLLVSQKISVKIGDFGESFLLRNKGKAHKFGITAPYAPPQLYHKNPPLNEKVDVYSFGVMLFKVLFNEHIWHYGKKEHFVAKLKTSWVQPLLIAEIAEREGNERIIKILLFLCIRCIDEDQQNRPKMIWILTVLQQCKKYLFKLLM